MDSSPAPPLIRPRGEPPWLWIVVVVLMAMLIMIPVLLAVGVTSYFQPSSDTKVLRNGLIKASGVEWRPRIVVNVGGLTLGAVRGGLSFFPLDARAHAALEAIRGAEVGIYELASAEQPDRATMLAAADTAMTARGWDRVVAVVDGDDLVAVYVSQKTTSARRLECCVLVFDGEQMILASAKANLQPLLEMALEEVTVRHKAKFLSKN